jgi:hypothetical protein
MPSPILSFFTYTKTGPPIEPLVILAPINALTLS